MSILQDERECFAFDSGVKIGMLLIELIDSRNFIKIIEHKNEE